MKKTKYLLLVAIIGILISPFSTALAIDKPINKPIPQPLYNPGIISTNQSVRDTYIYENSPTTNYGSQTLFNVFTGADFIMRSIIEFDLSFVPEGATISSASLDLYYYNYWGDDMVGRTLRMHRLRRADWEELQATYNIYKTGNNWGTAGAAHTTTDIDTSFTIDEVVPASYGWMNWDGAPMLSLVQDAIANRNDKLIVRLYDNSAAIYRGARFYSREYTGNTSRRPTIVIDYITTPAVTTDDATSIQETTATLNATLTSTGGENNDEQGFEWDIDSGTPYTYNQTSVGSFSAGAFNESITGLTEGELYYFRAISHNSEGWGNGSELTFLTRPVTPDTLAAASGIGESIDLTWSKGNGSDTTEIWGQSGSYPASRGIGTLTYNSTGTNHNDTNPSAGETWYYRAWSYATEGGLSQYSDTYDEDYTTCTINVSTVVTNNATSIEETWAVMNGNITSIDTLNVTIRGFQYDIDSGIPYSLNWTEGGSWGVGTYSRNITALDEGELYYFRATVYNAGGWGNGTELTFLTKPVEPASLVAASGAGESIDLTWSKGAGANTTEIWGQVDSYPASRGIGTLTYNSTGTNYNDTNPSTGETWYYRAWSYISAGGYSHYSDTYDQDSATCIVIPSVTTDAADDIEETTATLNANLTNTGGENNSNQGFEWDTDSGTPYSNNQTSGGSFNTGVFDEAITGLTKGDLYYFRGMSQNTKGWGYGNESIFLTKPDEPSSFVCDSNTTNSSIYLTWVSGTGRDTTVIRYATGSYPADVSSGILAYNSSGTTHDVTGLNISTGYYFRAWSWCTEGGEEQWSDAYVQCLEYTFPGNPSNLSAVTTNCSVALEWTKGVGGDITHLRGQQDSYPANVGSGIQIYFDDNDNIVHNIGHSEDWYYRLWAYNSTSTKYSANYSQIIADPGSCFDQLPLAPTDFTITQTGTGSVNISWTMGVGANTTIVRVSESDCPADYTDGFSVYSEGDNSVTYDDLNFTSATYCFRAWSLNDAGYSVDYAEGKIGGDNMVAIAFIILPLGLFSLALWQRKIWIMLGAGISFICLAAYGLIDGSSGEALWILGIFSVVFALIIFLYAFFGMREPAEVIPFEEPDDAYERELREARAERRSKRAWSRKPRR